MRIFLFAVFLFLTITPSASSGPFDGCKLVSVFAKSKQEAEFLHGLEKEYNELDFWTGPSQHKNNTILIPPHLLSRIEEAMTREGLTWRELEADVDKIIEDGMRKEPLPYFHHKRVRSTSQDIIDHRNYHSYPQIISYLEELEGKYPDNVKISYLKYPTHEGRKVVMIKLQGADNLTKKRSIVMESGIHAREWISPAATLYFIEKLLQKYQAGDNRAKFMLDSFDWHIVPSTNPDGYEYTQTGRRARLWRKNRRIIRWYCDGVDLNRNFDVYFGTTGVSTECGSNIYPGTSAFSEPETANIRELFNSIKDSVIAYLSVHSYSQFILIPWSFSATGLRPNTAKELTHVASKMAAAIEKTHGKVYKVGTAWDLLEYAASGSSKDWAFQTKEDIFAATYELRPDSDDIKGFNLPPNEIIPTGEEFFASLDSLTMEIQLFN